MTGQESSDLDGKRHQDRDRTAGSPPACSTRSTISTACCSSTTFRKLKRDRVIKKFTKAKQADKRAAESLSARVASRLYPQGERSDAVLGRSASPPRCQEGLIGASLVFMGTPDFAVPTLLELAGSGRKIACGLHPRAPSPAAAAGWNWCRSPVEREARRLGIPVFTPRFAQGRGRAGGVRGA